MTGVNEGRTLGESHKVLWSQTCLFEVLWKRLISWKNTTLLFYNGQGEVSVDLKYFRLLKKVKWKLIFEIVLCRFRVSWFLVLHRDTLPQVGPRDHFEVVTRPDTIGNTRRKTSIMSIWYDVFKSLISFYLFVKFTRQNTLTKWELGKEKSHTEGGKKESSYRWSLSHLSFLGPPFSDSSLSLHGNTFFKTPFVLTPKWEFDCTLL